MIRCECWACLSDEQVRCKCWVKTYMRVGLQPSWKRAGFVEIPMTRYNTHDDDQWRSRSSYDPDPVMMTPRDPDPAVMIQIEWWSRSSTERWSRSSDDPDPVQWCWSRSSDDLDPVMPFYDDPDREMIQIQMTWRRRWLEDEDDLKTKMIQLMQRRRPVLKNCVERIPS